MVEPLRIFEGVYTNVEGETARYTSAVYPPQFYGHWQSWACALRFSFAPDAFHFGYGRDAEHAIQRALEEARGFATLGNGQLVTIDGFDFKSFTEQGRKLPWDDDLEDHPGLASYSPLPFKQKYHSTPDDAPIRQWRGWQRVEGEMQEFTGAIYAPD